MPSAHPHEAASTVDLHIAGHHGAQFGKITSGECTQIPAHDLGISLGGVRKLGNSHPLPAMKCVSRRIRPRVKAGEVLAGIGVQQTEVSAVPGYAAAAIASPAAASRTGPRGRRGLRSASWASGSISSFSLALLIRLAEISMPTACAPRRASSRIIRPWPQATSTTRRPAGGPQQVQQDPGRRVIGGIEPADIEVRDGVVLSLGHAIHGRPTGLSRG